MVFHACDRRFGVGIGKAQAVENFLGHRRTDSFVSIEADAAGFIPTEGRGLADIVEEDGEHDRHRDLARQQ